MCTCAGSDDGRVFIYDARSGAPIIALEADEDVANCVAPHPSLPVLATSGIESAVRLWSPKGPAATPDLTQEIAANQVSRPHNNWLVLGLLTRMIPAQHGGGVTLPLSIL